MFLVYIAHVSINNLGTSWRNAQFNERQNLQKLIFPEGIYFDKQSDSYRTIRENEALSIFKRISTSYNADKEKAATDSALLSPSVEWTDKISNALKDFEKLVMYVLRIDNNSYLCSKD